MPVSYASFVTPTANVVPTLQGTKFTAAYANTATFTGDCALGEYREYVKGTYVVDGISLTHILCGSVLLSPSVYLENGCPPPNCTGYGHRACPPRSWSRYEPVQATGCQFTTQKVPGFVNVQASACYAMNLTYMAHLIDTSTKSILIKREWTVTGSVVVPRASDRAAPYHLAATDEIIGAHRTSNSVSAGRELHIVVSRPPEQPAIDASLIEMVLVTADGQRIVPAQLPAVHEIGGPTRTTASIVWALDVNDDDPAAVEIAVDGAVRTIEVDVETTQVDVE